MSKTRLSRNPKKINRSIQYRILWSNQLNYREKGVAPAEYA